MIGMVGEVDLLAQADGLKLVQVAQVALKQFVQQGIVLQLNLGQLPTAVQQPGATFVTLRHQGRLRGCIGNVVEERPLAESVIHNTVAAASRDPRFPPVNGRELAHVQVEVTVLTPLRRLPYKDYADLLAKVRPGVDGVMLKWGHKRGVLLPQVWDRVEQSADFLAAIAQKANIPQAKLRSQPPEVEVLIFQAQHFEKSD